MKDILYPVSIKENFQLHILILCIRENINSKVNNLGFLNGEHGDRNVALIKKDDVIRINCIGSSTMNYLVYENKHLSTRT